jgi:hypothetical protein
MFSGKRLELTDHGVGASARNFGFGEGGLGHPFDLHQRGGKRVDEGEFA